MQFGDTDKIFYISSLIGLNKSNKDKQIMHSENSTRLRIAFYTFGCRLNQAETSIIRRSFEKERYDVVDLRDDPDVVVVNTCTVTENGDADTHRLLNKINRNSPEAKVALVGCQAQVQRERLMKLPGVNWVIGNEHKMDFLKILEKGGLDTPQLITPPIKKKSFSLSVAGIDPQHTRANLKIQDGCDFFCSFCEIPYARGRARSRRFDDILKEANILTAAGHHELILTGINIGTYAFEGKTILDVVSSLENIDELWRIRISSIEPTTIPAGLLQKMRENNKLCRYLHIPIQSGSDVILQKMNRNYSISQFCDFLELAHASVPDICLGTDVIVGFPGETDEQFDETYDLLWQLPFAYFHVFSYSDREHSKSRKYSPKVPRDKIKQRSQRLRELSIRKRNYYYQKFIGTEMRVLFEQKKNGLWNGLTDNYIRVKVKSELDLQNQMLPVELERSEKQAMIGKLI